MAFQNNSPRKRSYSTQTNSASIYFIFRYANVYGPRQNPHGEAGIVAIFGELMKAGKQPTIFGDGTKARDYVYVGDVAAANLAALRHGKNATVNIGRGITTTDREMFDAIAARRRLYKRTDLRSIPAGEIYRISLECGNAPGKFSAGNRKWTSRKGVPPRAREHLAVITFPLLSLLLFLLRFLGRSFKMLL